MRLFWALAVPEDLAAAAASLQDEARRAGVWARWTDPIGLHLTLAFLGEVAEPELLRCLALGRDVAGRHRAGQAWTGEFGGFPTLQAARVWWLGLQACAELEDLAGDLARTLREGGFSVESRPFSPHLTLARLRTPRDMAGLGGGFRPCGLPFKEIRLFQSLRSPTGAQYRSMGVLSLEPGLQSP